MKQTREQRKEALLKEMKELADKINYAKMTMQPQAKLRQEFYKVSVKYKRYWNEDWKKEHPSL